MALVPGQQYTAAQIYAEDPNWLQTNAPQLYNAYATKVTQPALAISSGQAELPGKQATSNVATATQGANIASTQAKSTVDVNQADQLGYINQIKGSFDKVKGKDGYVSPQDYNKAKADATALNITGDAFDKTFQDSYVNPNNAFYNTPDAKIVRAQIKEAYNLINQYKGLSMKGSSEADILANLFGKVGIDAGGDTRAYKSSTTGLSSTIRGIVDASKGSGFRFNLQELNRIGDLLPQPSDTQSAAVKKLDILNQELKNSYGIGLEDYSKLDQQGALNQ